MTCSPLERNLEEDQAHLVMLMEGWVKEEEKKGRKKQRMKEKEQEQTDERNAELKLSRRQR